MKKFLALVGSTVIGLMLATIVRAAVENVAAQVTFAGPISILAVNQLQFGVIDEALNLEAITIDTAGVASGTGLPFMIQGTPLAADLTITATAGPTLSILVGAILPGPGYTLTVFRCKYAAEAEADCDVGGYTATAVGASATLKIGATLTGDNTATAGNADGSFDVTVVYQ
jgi:hypothetical protein